MEDWPVYHRNGTLTRLPPGFTAASIKSLKLAQAYYLWRMGNRAQNVPPLHLCATEGPTRQFRQALSRLAQVMTVINKAAENEMTLSKVIPLDLVQKALKIGREHLPMHGRTKYNRDAAVRTILNKMQKGV